MPVDSLNRLENVLMAFHRLGDELPPLDAFGITPSQVAYIEFIGQNPGSSQLALAKEFNFKPASVSLMVNLLVDKSLIKKEIDPVDARQAILHLSAEGEKVWKNIRNFRRNRLERMLSKLSITERNEFIRLFNKAIETK